MRAWSGVTECDSCSSERRDVRVPDQAPARRTISNGGVDCVDKMALLHFLVTAGAGVMFSIDTERRFPTFLSTGWFNRGGVEMSKVTWKRIVAPIAVLLLVVACRTEASATDTEAAIRSLETSFAAAVRAKDLDKIMAHYTVSEDLVVFDVVPPRQYTGWKAYKEDWREFLAGCKDSPTFEISELETYGGARYAYSHSIQHFSCTNQQGKKRD